MPEKWNHLKEISDEKFTYLSVSMPGIEERGQLVMKSELSIVLDLMKEMAEALEYYSDHKDFRFLVNPKEETEVRFANSTAKEVLHKFKEWK